MSHSPSLLNTTGGIIDADAQQAEAAEIKPRAWSQGIVARELVLMEGSHATD